jgi:ribosomal protein L11 methyltransferase
MPWLAVELTVERDHFAVVEAALEALGALSITLMDSADVPILEPGVGETPLWPMISFEALFDAEIEQAELIDALGDSLGSLKPQQIQFRWVDDQDWERVWLDRFKPMPFGNKLWIVPTGYAPPTQAQVVLHLDPGLAFGTGTHPTTAMCLQWLDGLAWSDETVLDYGSGSGVLAVAALLLGAGAATAVDNDPQALLASAANAERNGVRERLLVQGIEAPLARYDRVVANILAGPLIDLAPTLMASLKPNGAFALSGILAEQAHWVERAYLPFAQQLSRAEQDGWIRIDGIRR